MAGKPEKSNNKMLTEIIKTLVAVIEEKGIYNQGHYDRVANICVHFAKTVNFNKNEIESLFLASLVYDIGMVYLPADIIHKQDSLPDDKMADDQIALVKQHPVIAEKILSNLSIFTNVLPIVRHHHEAFDGSGYPDGLAGEEIPIGARILSLADSYQALIAIRSHKPTLRVTNAFEEMLKNEKRYDPKLLKTFIEFIKSNTGRTENTAAPTHSIQVWDVVKDIVEKIREGKIDLPVLPEIVQKVQNVIESPHATAKDLAKVIESDPVISVRLIATSNSPFYRGKSAINTVKQAIPRLGVKEVRNVVIAIANKSIYEAKNEQFKLLMEKLWKHSLACAYSAVALAKELNLSDPEKYFSIGLVHDIGKVLLLRKLSETTSPDTTFDMDEVISGMSDANASLSGIILRHWKFTKDFIRAATMHESSAVGKATERVVLVTNAANNLASAIGYGLLEEDIDLSSLKSVQLLKLDDDTLLRLSEGVKKAMQDLVHTF